MALEVGKGNEILRAPPSTTAAFFTATAPLLSFSGFPRGHIALGEADFFTAMGAADDFCVTDLFGSILAPVDEVLVILAGDAFLEA